MVAIQEVDGPLPGNKDKVTRYYDGLGNLIREENGWGHTTLYDRHNGRGQPGRITGPNEDITEYTYDARGRVVAIRVGSGSALSETRYTYTAGGQLESVTTPDGLEVRHFYDAARRLVKTSTPESVNVSVHRTYSYDAASNITQVIVTRDTPPVPQAPPVVIGSSFTVKWSAQPGVVRYVLQESKDGGAWSDVYSGASVEWSASARSPGSYSYRLMACTADGQCSRPYFIEESVLVRPDLSPIINYLLNS